MAVVDTIRSEQVPNPTHDPASAEATIISVDPSPTHPKTPGSQLRFAYLLSCYPAVSHTFFLHEVLGLRARGMHIETASINPTDRPVEMLPDIEATEARTTRYIKSGSKSLAMLELLSTAVTTPAAFFRGLHAWASIPRLTLSKRLLWLFYLAEAVLVGRWMKQRQLNHLHVHFGGPVASVGMLAARMWQVPFSITIHGPEELLDYNAYHLREKIAAASLVICISDFCRSQLYLHTPPEQWSKFKVVRLGVDPVMLSPRKNPATLQSSATDRILQMVVIGRMVPQKGHRILLESLLQLRDRGLAVHTTFIGGGPDLASLQAFVALHKLRDLVSFTGALSHEQALSYLRRADLFALASFAEGIPVALMEAMSLGLACVSTNIAGIPELIRTGTDGTLAPPGNVAALTEAIEALLLDPMLRRQFGASARQRILSHYNLPLNQELLAQTFAENVTPARGLHLD